MRSIFITLYFVYLLFALIFSVVMFSISPEGIGWFSAIVAHGIPLFWFIFIRLGRLTNHSFVSLLTTAGTGTAFLICLGNNRINGSDNLTAILPAIALIGWLIYDRWYVVDHRKTRTMIKGEVFPDITFKDADGRDFHLSKSQHPKVLVFYTSPWSSFTKFQQRDFELNSSEFEERGIELYFIGGENGRSNGKGIHFLNDSGQAQTQLQLSNRQKLPLGLSVFGFDHPVHRPHLYILDQNNCFLSEKIVDDIRKLPNSEWVLRFF